MTTPPVLSPEAMELFNWMGAQLATAVGIDVRDVTPDRPLVGYGLDSPDAIELALTIEQAIGIDLPATLFWDYPTLGLVAEYLWREHRARAPRTRDR